MILSKNLKNTLRIYIQFNQINGNDDAIETKDDPVHCPDRNKLLQIIENMQKNSPFLQKMVQLFNLMQIMLLA